MKTVTTLTVSNNTELVNKYAPSNLMTANAELKARVKYIVENTHCFDFIKDELETALDNTISASLKARQSIPEEYSKYISQDKVEVSDSVWSKSVKDLPKDVKSAAYTYRNYCIRRIMLNSILKGKVKVSKLVKDTLIKVLTETLRNSPTSKNREWVQLSKVISSVKIKADVIGRDGKVLQKGDQWLEAQMALQFISELCELDYLDGDIITKTHYVKLPDAITGSITADTKDALVQLAAMADSKTIFTSAPEISKQLITTSSWFYRTPTLSDAQIAFVTRQQDIKYQFIDNAEDLIEDAYKAHLKLEVLPKWAEAKVKFFKEQIRASHENGGHHIAGKFDSALRYYMIGEIGHFQTSAALRSLVKVKGIDSKVKYDFRNNVVQMYSLGTGIRDLAKYVGLVPAEEEVEDVRLQLAERMNKELGVTNFTKDTTKPLFMIWAYNAGQ